jgi:pimeloyl-ACP methyl ester carboxylesterase
MSTPGVLELGEEAGPAVVYCHGWPSSRLEARFLERAAAEARVRLLAFDRPGYGEAPFVAGRRIVDWPSALGAWADARGLDRFALLGFSGGAPYALAAAAALGDRVTSVGVVSAVAPPEAVKAHPEAKPPAWVGLNLARYAPWLARWLWKRAARQWLEEPKPTVAKMFERLPEDDRLVLALRVPTLVASVQEALRPGPQGAVHEAALLAKPWGFALGDIAHEVLTWHGEEDRNVPVTLARWTAAALPRVRATYLAGAGHFSALVRNGAAVLRALAG